MNRAVSKHVTLGSEPRTNAHNQLIDQLSCGVVLSHHALDFLPESKAHTTRSVAAYNIIMVALSIFVAFAVPKVTCTCPDGDDCGTNCNNDDCYSDTGSGHRCICNGNWHYCEPHTCSDSSKGQYGQSSSYPGFVYCGATAWQAHTMAVALLSRKTKQDGTAAGDYLVYLSI